MALQVWLPLNGNLNNQGLSNLTIANGSATASSDGKIGSCYTFNGSNSFVSLSGSSLNSIFKGSSYPFSISFWVYHADSTRAIIFGDYGLSGSISFNVELTTSHLVRLYWAGSPDKRFTDSSVGVNTWTHICLTYNGSKVSIYKNGSLLSDSYSSTLGSLSKTSGSFYLGRDARTGATALNGKLNDFRVYDHCLSPKEVKELSKGLVLHYKLEDSSLPSGLEFYDYIENTSTSYIDTEYVIGPSNCGNIKIYADFIATNTQVGNKWWAHGLGGNTGLTVYVGIGNGATGDSVKFTYGNGTQDVQTTVYGNIGTRYSYLLDLKNKTYKITEVNGNVLLNLSNITVNTPSYSYSPYIFAWRRGNNGTLGSSHSDKMYSFKLYDNDVLVRNFIPCSYNGTAGMWDTVEEKFYGNKGNGSFVLGNKLSLISLASDCSGYKNNGTIIGNLSVNDDSPRYNNCLYFNGSSYIKTLPNELSWSNYEYLTISAWMKPTVTPTSYTGSIGIGHNGNNTYKCFAISNSYYGKSGKFVLEMANGSYTCIDSNYVCPINEWHHYAVTLSGTTLNMYVDGVLKKTATINWGTAINHPNPQFQVGVDLPGTDETYTGYYSDVRIYATALSDNDIKELYDTSAYIYNDGTLAAYGFVEETSSPQIFKSGVFKSTKVSEYSDNLKILSDGSVWIRMLYHSTPSSNLFTTGNCWNNSATNLYSRLGLLKNTAWKNSSGKYEFLVYEKLESYSAEGVYRWTQTSNPATATTASGYELVSGSPAHLSPGICSSNGQHGAIDISGPDWWCCLGCYTAYQGGIPGFNGVVKSGYIDFYVRVPDVKMLNEDKAILHSDNIQSKQIIEI